MALSLAPLAVVNAATLNLNEELVGFSGMQVLPYAGGTVTQLNAASPLLCALLRTGSAPLSAAEGANRYVNPVVGNLVFGAISAANTQAPIAGVSSWAYTSNGLSMLTDPSLVCYGTSANGVMRYSPGLFADDFQTLGFDASIVTRVVQLPTGDNGNIYKYYVDVTAPVISATQSVVIAIRDGYDKSLFDSGTSYYCNTAGQGQTTCSSSLVHENINVTETIPAGSGLSRRYIVIRPLKAGASLTPTSVPVTLAALYLPYGYEKRLDNNVAPTYGQITDALPEIVSGPLASSLLSMTEGGSLTGVTFGLDDDTTETSGNLLRATATLTFNNTPFDVPVNCGASTPITANPRVTRTCSLDVITPAIDYATDIASGTYAPGVTAKLTIVATDARGQTTTTELPIHVASADNDKPVFTVSSTVAPPAGGPNKTPTITCSLVVKGSPQCVGTFSDLLTDIGPGPEGATDELAAQTVALVQDTSTGRNGNIACALDSGSLQIFGLSGGPRVTLSGSGKEGGVVYGLSENQGAATCTVVLTDGGTFPPGQTAKTESKTFRIVVTP